MLVGEDKEVRCKDRETMKKDPAAGGEKKDQELKT